MTERLERLIALIDDTLAAVDRAANSELAAEAVLQQLARDELARYRFKPAHDHSMTLAGVSASCTGGWLGLLRNWVSAARRRVEREAAR